MDERLLITRARDGDSDAFNELASRYIDRIYRLAYKVSGNEMDAQDILQETFLRAIDNIDSFRIESSFGTWLYAIAMNVMRTCFAKRKRMALKSIDDYVPDHSDAGASQLLEWSDPHELFEKSEIREMIDSFIAQMPEENSTPFILRYVEGMPVREIADAMNLTVPAVKSRILRARLALRDHISSKMEEKLE